MEYLNTLYCPYEKETGTRKKRKKSGKYETEKYNVPGTVFLY